MRIFDPFLPKSQAPNYSTSYAKSAFTLRYSKAPHKNTWKGEKFNLSLIAEVKWPVKSELFVLGRRLLSRPAVRFRMKMSPFWLQLQDSPSEPLTPTNPPPPAAASYILCNNLEFSFFPLLPALSPLFSLSLLHNAWLALPVEENGLQSPLSLPFPFIRGIQLEKWGRVWGIN